MEHPLHAKRRWPRRNRGKIGGVKTTACLSLSLFCNYKLDLKTYFSTQSKHFPALFHLFRSFQTLLQGVFFLFKVYTLMIYPLIIRYQSSSSSISFILSLYFSLLRIFSSINGSNVFTFTIGLDYPIQGGGAKKKKRITEIVTVSFLLI